MSWRMCSATMTVSDLTDTKDFDLSHLAAMPTLHPRQRGVHKGLVLKEMKMLPGALGSIMNRLIPLRTSRTSQAFDLTGEIKVDLSLIRLKANIRYFPRLLETQGGRKRGLSIPWDSKLIEGSEGPLEYANSHSKRKSAHKLPPKLPCCPRRSMSSKPSDSSQF